jgi:hypothetical protein
MGQFECAYCSFAYTALVCFSRVCRVGVFPEDKEIVIRCASFRASPIGVRSLQGLCFNRIGASESEMRQGADGFVQYSARMVEDLLSNSAAASLP